MNTKQIGIGIVIGGIVFGISKLFGASKKLQFGQIKIRDKRFYLSLQKTGVDIVLSCPVVNPTKTALPYSGFDGAINYGKIKLATVSDSRSFTVAKESTTNFSFTIFINFFQLGGQIIEAIKSGDFLNAAYLQGNIKSGSLKIPIKQKIF